MKILCLIDSLDSGGAERQMSYLTTGLKRIGSDVELVVFSSGYDFFRPYIENRGVNIINNTKGKNPFKRILEISKLVKQKRPDIVIAYKDGVTIAACLARIICRFHLIVSERNTSQTLTLKERIKFFLYRMADFVVPNSHSQTDFILKKYPSLAKKTKTITNCIDLSRFTNRKENKTSKVIKGVTLARVVEQKNVLRFIEALSILKKDIKINFHMDWYGNLVDEEYVKSVKETIKHFDVSEMITFHKPEKDIVSILNNADFFVLPSIYEGFANVICEAMAASLPIVCSNVADNGYIVKGESLGNLVFDPFSTQDIASKITKMIERSEEERTSVGKKNHERITELCSQDLFINNYFNLF